jgi:hypothetical protein
LVRPFIADQPGMCRHFIKEYHRSGCLDVVSYSSQQWGVFVVPHIHRPVYHFGNLVQAACTI